MDSGICVKWIKVGTAWDGYYSYGKSQQWFQFASTALINGEPWYDCFLMWASSPGAREFMKIREAKAWARECLMHHLQNPPLLREMADFRDAVVDASLGGR